MDDNRRNYNEQEGDYFGKRYSQDGYFQRGDERATPRNNFNNQPQNFGGNQSNMPINNNNINGMPNNNMQRQYPPMPMQGGQVAPMRQPIPQPQANHNFNGGYGGGYNQNGFPNMPPQMQSMQQPMAQMPPQMMQMQQPMPQQNSGFYAPSNQYFMQPENGVKKKNSVFGKGKKTLEEEFNDDMRNVIIAYPKTLNDVQMIIDNLRERQAIIVDLTKINDMSSQRILDYLSGAIYALGGSQQRIADNMFLFTPDGVSIQGPTDLKRKYE